MTSSMQLMLDAQKILLRHKPNTPQYEIVLRELRANVPAPVLAHFLRLIVQQRNGVAIVRRGVCSECHLRVSLALVSTLARSDDLHLCENCGCYLMLAPEEQAATLAAPKRVARRVATTSAVPA
jgi:predicted  nucleic acid-binding Zn-ribbon protein